MPACFELCEPAAFRSPYRPGRLCWHGGRLRCATAMEATDRSFPSRRTFFPGRRTRRRTNYRFPGPAYDGQFDHYIAYDPLMTRSFAKSIDAPRLRYRRVIVPAVAFVLVFGQDRAIAFGCIAALRCPSFWGHTGSAGSPLRRGFQPRRACSSASRLLSRSPPERLTVDAALAACCPGFALYLQELSDYKLYAILPAAALIRENGLLLTAACALFLVGTQDFGLAILFSTATVPAVCWYFFCRAAHSGAVCRFHPPHREPIPYPLTGLAVPILRVLDLLALAGIGAALSWAVCRAFGHSRTPVTVAI
jgi:hypothetical protein